MVENQYDGLDGYGGLGPKLEREILPMARAQPYNPNINNVPWSMDGPRLQGLGAPALTSFQGVPLRRSQVMPTPSLMQDLHYLAHPAEARAATAPQPHVDAQNLHRDVAARRQALEDIRRTAFVRGHHHVYLMEDDGQGPTAWCQLHTAAPSDVEYRAYAIERRANPDLYERQAGKAKPFWADDDHMPIVPVPHLRPRAEDEEQDEAAMLEAAETVPLLEAEPDETKAAPPPPPPPVTELEAGPPVEGEGQAGGDGEGGEGATEGQAEEKEGPSTPERVGFVAGTELVLVVETPGGKEVEMEPPASIYSWRRDFNAMRRERVAVQKGLPVIARDTKARARNPRSDPPPKLGPDPDDIPNDPDFQLPWHGDE